MLFQSDQFIRKTSFSFSTLDPIDCEWGEWIAGQCSKSCNTGIRNSTRTKTVNEMYNGQCVGNDTFQEDCNIQECPGNSFEIHFHEISMKLILFQKNELSDIFVFLFSR